MIETGNRNFIAATAMSQRVVAWRELLSIMGKDTNAAGSALETSSSAVLRTLLASTSAEVAVMSPAPLHVRGKNLTEDCHS